MRNAPLLSQPLDSTVCLQNQPQPICEQTGWLHANKTLLAKAGQGPDWAHRQQNASSRCRQRVGKPVKTDDQDNLMSPGGSPWLPAAGLSGFRFPQKHIRHEVLSTKSSFGGMTAGGAAVGAEKRGQGRVASERSVMDKGTVVGPWGAACGPCEMALSRLAGRSGSWTPSLSPSPYCHRLLWGGPSSPAALCVDRCP